MLFIAGAQHDSAKWLVQMSVRILRSKAGVQVKEPRMASKMVVEKILLKKMDLRRSENKKRDLRTSNVLVREVLLGGEEALEYYCGDDWD